MRTYDFISIGGGNAGLTAASLVKRAGKTVAVIDCGNIGGLCSLNGCNPKKVLVRSTEVFDEVQHAEKFGIHTHGFELDWPKVSDRKQTFTSPVTQSAEESLQKQGIDLITGQPRFVSKNEVDVSGTRLAATGLVIATGSKPRPLTMPGANHLRISNDLLALREVPKNLVIIGAGVVAFELGQVYARAGAKARLLEPGKAALGANDQDLVQALLDFSKGIGLEVSFESKVKAVVSDKDGFRVVCACREREKIFPADLVVNAAGRVAAIEDLNLDAANVSRDKRGVVVDDFLRSTTNPAVFAAGDAHGRLQLSPIASYEGRIVARNFLQENAERVNYDSIPKSVFTIPPLASVGLTEAQATANGLKFKVYSNDMAGWTVYRIAGEELARSKVLVEEGSSRILGAHILGSSAAEDIHIFSLAIRFGITATALKELVYVYPTFASALAYTMG